MATAIHCATKLGDFARYPRGSLVVNHQHGFEDLALVRAQTRLQFPSRRTCAPVSRHAFHLEAHLLRELSPE